ncbi:MAG: DUF6361 family protein [Gordonia amarae]
MVSAFGWLDTDESQRQKMMEIIELFKEEGMVDELGIGAIRNAFANALFPGTSVQHTRIRYALFVPWLLERAARESSPEGMIAALRRHEVQLIYALLKNRQVGVIGKQAKERLHRMPSSMYWAQIGRWGLLRPPRHAGGVSIAKFFQHAHAVNSLHRRSIKTDDDGIVIGRGRYWLDPDLPPAPPGFPDEVVFHLTSNEEEYLSTKIATATEGSLLGWLVNNPPRYTVDYVWELPFGEIGSLPSDLASLVDQARRFHTAIAGAPTLYYLMLAEALDDGDLIDLYRGRLHEWREEVATTRVLEGWDRSKLWFSLRRVNRRLAVPTQAFVDGWLDHIGSDTDVAASEQARELVSRRERQTKGGRARLANRSSLDAWSGSDGMGRFDYRWGTAQNLLTELDDARSGRRPT